MSDALTTLKHYFVDEAGDPVLFSGNRMVIEGSVVKDFFTTAAAGKTFETVRKTRNRIR